MQDWLNSLSYMDLRNLGANNNQTSSYERVLMQRTGIIPDEVYNRLQIKQTKKAYAIT
jgi:hypothetical protein